ncbi:MAG: hypothetical protein GWP06_05200 [Actinobacteria bacterium]|nr:hypothetical protein [Actinomycetota bacterium]
MSLIAINILLTYSSGYGATREISDEIGKVLSEDPALKVDLKPIDDIQEISAYDAIIVGTSIRADRPLANTRDFFALNRDILTTKKVALFIVCLTASTEEGQAKVRENYFPQITEKYPSIKLISTAAFGGKVDFDKLNPVMQNLVRRVVLEKTGKPSNGSFDARDWAKIHDWARELAYRLKHSE